ncbi:hypothetical protein ACFV23_17360 [Streptomyces sp. NPDC059627]
MFRISDRITTPVASLIEPFTVAHRAVTRSRPQPGDKAPGDAPDVDTFVEAAGPDFLIATIQSMAKPGARIVAVA